ncbi:MAG: glycosyltransferase family 2 protein [Patescibacteria group bacterium]|nr:glycosyltransferase family 2 protein [Patescibacteria group bacterium]
MLPSLSILIPAYNVEKTVRDVLEKAHDVGTSIAKQFEIIVLDDGSTDETPNILKTIPWKELKIITHKKNQGYGITIKNLYYAGSMAWLATLPADDQIDPEELRKLEPFHTKADMILGKREIRHDHIKRKIQSKTYNYLLKLLFNIPTTDVNTIRLMKKEMLKTIKLTTQSAFVDAELVLKAHKQGYKILETPILHKPRTTPGATGGKFFATILPTIRDMIQFSSLR